MEESNEKWIREIEEDKIMKKFWKGIRQKRVKIDKGIKKNNGRNSLEGNLYGRKKGAKEKMRIKKKKVKK